MQLADLKMYMSKSKHPKKVIGILRGRALILLQCIAE